MLEFFASLAGVVLVDLLLAGDNALVIGMAAGRLPEPRRKQAILWGSLAAILLRLLFAAILTLLLQIPLLRAMGGVLLLWVAWRLLLDSRSQGSIKAGISVWDAVRIIVLADVVMSLDNVLALAGVSRGDLVVLAAGLALTVPLIMWGAGLVSALIHRFHWLVYAGVGVLVWAAGEMILADPWVETALRDLL